MAKLVPFREMATYVAGGSSAWDANAQDEWVERGEVLRLVAALIGLSRHTLLLAWKEPSRMTPPMYYRLVCFWACARFERDRVVRMGAMRGIPVHETVEWELVGGKPVGVSCVLDDVVHFTLLFTRFEAMMRLCGREADCFRPLGGVDTAILGEGGGT